MTDIKAALAGLDIPGHMADAIRDVFLHYGKTVLSFDDSARMADAAFAAYRSGQLVPVPSVETVAKAIFSILWQRECYNGVRQDDIDQYRKGGCYDMGGRVEAYETQADAIATAVIAAMKGARDGSQ